MNHLTVNQKHGFTLIEILVVLAIVTVLVAISFPILGSVQRKGHDSIFLSNLRQIGVSTRLYMDDNDGRYPNAIDPRTRERRSTSLVPQKSIDESPDYVDVLNTYMRTSSLYRCPLDTDKEFQKWKTSYYYNEILNFYYPLSKVQAANASKISLFRDADFWHGVLNYLNSEDHFVQIVCIDLHVKRIRVGQLNDDEIKELGEEGIK